jgi:hypothetical protein
MQGDNVSFLNWQNGQAKLGSNCAFLITKPGSARHGYWGDGICSVNDGDR